MCIRKPQWAQENKNKFVWILFSTNSSKKSDRISKKKSMSPKQMKNTDPEDEEVKLVFVWTSAWCNEETYFKQ